MESLSLQLRTLRMFGELLALDAVWAGKLVVTAGAGCASSGVPAAVAIAGGVCLAVDADSQSARAGMREGGVDFVVNTLDEALRVMKNEVRQKRPLGVALAADVAAVRAEANERGVLADLAVNAEGFAAREFLEWDGGASARYTEWRAAKGWREAEVEAVPEFADERALWMRGVPRYQRSAGRERRWLWV
jgi:urocanate hydratase